MLTFYVAFWGSSRVGSVFGNDRSACARPYIQYCYLIQSLSKAYLNLSLNILGSIPWLRPMQLHHLPDVIARVRTDDSKGTPNIPLFCCCCYFYLFFVIVAFILFFGYFLIVF